MESAKLIPKETEAFKTCYIKEVSRLKDNSVRGCAYSHPFTCLGFIHREISVVEIHKIFGKSEDTALKVRTSGKRIKIDVAPIAAVKFFVGINKQLQCGGFIIAVTVCIIKHVVKTVLGQVNCFDIIKRNG